MFMKISWGKVRPGQWKAFEAAYRKAIDQKTIPGLKSRWLAQDVNDPDAGHSITLWENLEALQKYEQSDLYKKVIVPACEEFYANEVTVNISRVVATW
jgi:heme-degrading monooxygenase HmoA